MSPLPPDIELWATGYLRDHLVKIPHLQVDIRTPEDYTGSYPLIVVRNDGGSKDEFTRYTYDLTVNVYSGNRSNPAACQKLANKTFTLLTDIDQLLNSPDSPVLSVDIDNCTIPHVVPHDESYCHYTFVISLRVVAA